MLIVTAVVVDEAATHLPEPRVSGKHESKGDAAKLLSSGETENLWSLTIPQMVSYKQTVNDTVPEPSEGSRS